MSTKTSYLSKSPWVIHYDASSCNGCDIEVLATLCPGFDAERFGVINTGNPKQADIFMVTGSVNERNIKVIREIYDQMLEPKVVVACGICACSGGIFHDCYNVLGGVDKAIPVDVYAPGCAVRPETLIDAVVEACAILEEKAEAMKAGKKPGQEEPAQNEGDDSEASEEAKAEAIEETAAAAEETTEENGSDEKAEAANDKAEE
ncbi:MAG: NADH-quinone oxidoreductase subunit NuoB [Phoenicibacter congonensis]|uniref:NADH-quinone oxidoreductase subunit NuoB n=1 Tax=Phoenicibacter congonensis TaxID=1944646 RepID=A0AA43RHI7_9ACTN|nr:NADH-quinone oxidoreductase subunit NuoB [Phoenicibacter congonensis]